MTLVIWNTEHNLYTDDSGISTTQEIMTTFFEWMNLQVDYHYLFPWENVGGVYNETTDSWNGVIGLVRERGYSSIAYMYFRALYT